MNPHKIPGRIVGDRLIKSVIRARHFLRCQNGYAWAEAQLMEAKSKGVRVLELLEDSGRVLRVGLDYVLAHGKRFQYGTFEPQIGIPESAMTALDPHQPELFRGML